MTHPWLDHYDADVPHTIDYPRPPLYQLLEESAAQGPERPCVTFFGKTLNYKQIKTYSDNLAASLQRRGLQPGERVALLLPNAPQYPISYYGILKAGGVVVALNPLANVSELIHLVSDSGAKILITIPTFMEAVQALAAETPLEQVVLSRLADFMPLPLKLAMGAREWWQARPGLQGATQVAYKRLIETAAPPDFTPAAVDVDETAVMLYSGGTTGVAKGIMLSHFNCVANAHQLRAWGHLAPDDKLLSVLPLFHGYGMSVNMNAALLAGGEMILVPRFDARDVLKHIEKYRPTFFTGVPTMFVAFSNLPDVQEYDLSSLNGIFVGAAPLTQGIKDEFEGKTGGRMIEGYGLTEAVTAIMANPYRGEHKIGSIGIPFPDVEMKIVDLETGETAVPEQRGEIALRSPTVMIGYYNRPQATAEALRDGWLHTGDIGYMDEDGYFYITDRKKDLIIVGGFNVFPREIEEVLYRHPQVKEGVAVGIPDEYAGERIKVFVTLKEGETATEEDFIAYFRQHLTRYKVPSVVEFREDLPKSMVGKILRRELRQEEKARADSS
jgi:long-chain acyl-CoA synthetase